jgi:glycine betaine/proline transport system permease protein
MPDIDLGAPADDVVQWLLDNFGWLFDAIGSVATDVVDWIVSVLTWPPSLVTIVLLTLIPVILRRWGIAAFSLLAFSLIDAMDLWTETMQSLAVVIVATVVAIALGVPLGIWAARRRVVSVLVRPLLDLMQTTPPFVYLIPAVFFFGVGVVPGVVATAVFALAPAVRLTELGIRQVDHEVVEAARAFGAPPRRVLLDVQLPLALPSIMAGINQVIMLALSMVVVAGLAGAEGLGAIVTSAVTQLDIGAGSEGGLAVVILAVYLDRVTSALAAPGPTLFSVARRRDGSQPDPARSSLAPA